MSFEQPPAVVPNTHWPLSTSDFQEEEQDPARTFTSEQHISKSEKFLQKSSTDILQRHNTCCKYSVIQLQVHLNKLECRGKVHLFQ